MNSIEYWLKEPVQAVINRLSAREVAVDVGANVGTWTEPLSAIFDQVLAVEPDERASSQIKRQKNVVLLDAAVSDETGSAEFYFRNTTGHNSLLEVHPIGGEGMAPVPVVETKTVDTFTLDELLDEGADFVKIDIEGGEVAALQGCVDKKRWSRTAFVVECHDTFAEVAAELERLGKNVTRIPHPLAGACHPGHCWAIGE